MKRKTQIISMLLGTTLVISLVACGSTESANNNSSAEASTTTAEAASESTKNEEINETASESKETTSENNETDVNITSTDQVTMSFANTQPEGDIETQALFECEKRIEEATNGNFQIEVYPNSSMGDTDDLLEQAIEGANVLTITDPSRMADYNKDYGILQMPYLIPDYTYIEKIVNTEQVKEWEQSFEDDGVKVLCSNWYGGTRNFICNKEVNTPDDLKGLKIRTMGNDMCIESVNAMGAVGTAMPMSEVYSGIEQKAIDGCELQSTSVYALHLYEVEKYINKTKHFILLGVPAMSADFFNSLPEDYQQLLVKTFTEVGEEYQEIGAQTEQEDEKKMQEEGMTIHDLDTGVFEEAVQPVYTSLGYNDLRDQIYKTAGINK